MTESTAHDRRQRRMLIALALFFFAPLAVSFYLYYGGSWRPGHRVNRGDLIDPPRPLPDVALPLARPAASAAADTATPASSSAVPAPAAPENRVAATAPGAAAGIGAAAPVAEAPSATEGGAAGSAGSAPATAALTKPDFLKGKWTLLYWGAGACNARCRTNLYNTRQVRTALNRDMDRVQRVFLAEGACCDWPYLEHEHPDLITLADSPGAAPLLALLPSVGGIAPETADRLYLIDPLGNLMMSYAPDAKPKGLLEDLKRLLGLSQVG